MSIIDIQISRKVFNDVYFPFLDNRDRYLVFYGGGSSGKSYFIAQRIIYRMLLPERHNYLIVRQTGDTNRKSTFPLLKQVITNWNLAEYFKINETDMRIRCTITGNQAAFAGLDDVEKIKSVTFDTGELTDIWVEEATETQEKDINQLKVRLRGGKSDKQMLLSFNPVNIRHWIKGHFIDSGLATVCFSTYQHNKFLTAADRKALEDLKLVDDYTYRVYCLGQWGVLGKTVFDARAIQARLEQPLKPIRTGYFTYDYDGRSLTNIKWVSDREGYIRLYDVPRHDYYCLGGDTAGDGSDYFTGHVIDARSGQQVAVLRHQFDADQYTRQMYCLGKHFRQALIGIEANFDTYPIRELQRLGYPKQYVREAADTYTGRTEKRFGFKTTSVTRPAILSRLIEIVREHSDRLQDRDTLEELLTIIRSEKGRIEAPQGGHDDLMMGLAIAYEIRDQVAIPADPIIMAQQTHFTAQRRYTPDSERGEQITVI